MFTPYKQESSLCTLKPRKLKEGAQGKMMLTSSIEAHIVKHNFLILPSSTKTEKHNYIWHKCVIWPLKITIIWRKTKPFIRAFDTPMRHIDCCGSKRNYDICQKAHQTSNHKRFQKDCEYWINEWRYKWQRYRDIPKILIHFKNLELKVHLS